MVRALASTGSRTKPSRASVSMAQGSSTGIGSVDVDDIVSEIGPKIRALRGDLGLSLQQMATLAEVSAASIHKIERGDMVPTITTLLKLAAAFRRPVSYFIDEDPGRPSNVWYTPRGKGEPVATGNRDAEVQQVSGPMVRYRNEATFCQLASGFTEQRDIRPGEELLYMLAGSVDVQIDDEKFTLRKGDTLHYLTDRPFQWANNGKTTAELLRIRLSNT